MTASDASFPSLVELSLNQALKSFSSKPFRAERSLRPDVALSFYSKLPSPTPETVDILASHVENDQYWRRACGTAGPGAEEHGRSHKRRFFERTFATDGWDAAAPSSRLVRGMSSDDIHTVKLCGPRTEGPFDELPNLTNIDLKHASALNLKASIPKVIALSSLTTLALTESQLDDEDILPIVDSQSNLLHLDLSHNNVSSDGATAIAEKLLSPPTSVLSSLDLSGNNISSDGASAVAKSLATNESLLSLTLRLNNIGDEGGKDMFDSLAQSSCLRYLNMSANKLSSADALLRVLDEISPDHFLETIVLTSNAFSEKDATRLRCCEVCFIDVRTINCEPDESEKRNLASETI